MALLAIIAVLLLFGLIAGPRLWISWVMKKHSVDRPDFPGTGGELARYLLDAAGLKDVKLETTHPMGDHYSPVDQVVRLSPDNMNGRSVTAVAVAAHEVGHAIQHRDGYAPLMLRHRLAGLAATIERVGGIVLMATPFVFALVRSPLVLAGELAAGLAIMASTVIIHVFTLPTEFDASYKRALPALASQMPPEDVARAREVLRAAAFTYVAGALISLINVARWLRVLRF